MSQNKGVDIASFWTQYKDDFERWVRIHQLIHNPKEE